MIMAIQIRLEITKQNKLPVKKNNIRHKPIIKIRSQALPLRDKEVICTKNINSTQLILSP